MPAVALFAAAFAVTPSGSLFAQAARPAAAAARPAASAAKPAAAPAAATVGGIRAAVAAPEAAAAEPIILTVGNEYCEINDPFSKAPLDGARWTVRGPDIRRNVRAGGGVVLQSKRLADTVNIVWPTPPKQMEDAVIAYQRGDAQTALRLIQDVLNFFERMKKDTPGSLWLKAASIKLDALMVLQNDTVLSGFIRELEAVDSSTVPGLADRIKLAKLAQISRTGNPKATVAEADALIGQVTTNEILAQIHIIKGDALLADRQPEKAMNAFLRVNVFYGNPPSHIPAAQLGAAKAFRAMNSPALRALKLEDVANAYLRDIIKEYPLTKEAEIAKGMLPKDEREAEAKAAAAREQATEAATDKQADANDTLPDPAAAPAATPAAETPAASADAGEEV